jgi:hypothetical protein
MFVLRKDGKYLSHHNTEFEALQQLHRIQGMSHDYAFRFGGYTLKNEKVVAINTITHKAEVKEKV